MKQKGFTLIELLAVIVVLAIIAVIAVPTILKVIEKAKQGAASSSAFGYVNALEKQIALDQLDTTKESIKDGTYNISQLNVSVKGETPSEGTAVIENMTVKKATFKFNDYYVCYAENKAQVNKDKANLKDCGDLNEILYTETILNGTDPVISGDLIPVTIENDGIVRKADLYSKWYNYENKMWANAVILEDKTKTYKDGDKIPENNIQSYFVWIPRYKYQIFDEQAGNYTGSINGKPTTSKAQTINIEFENKETEVSNGSNFGDWLTHPAFTSFNSNGMWVGKFEMTGTSSNVTVKPGIKSLREVNVKTLFELSYNYQRNLDSHMMKNTEWGAVAYLSHSKYGINEEVNINNNSEYLTGYSQVNPATCKSNKSESCNEYGTDENITKTYNTEIGYKASTTGNITGIYDMSGGAWEYVAAYRANTLLDSGFTTNNIAGYDSKYFDIYPTDSNTTTYNKRILGDATGEMGTFYYYADKDGSSRYHNNWYADYSIFVAASFPWFVRGGNYSDGILADQFYFGRHTGAASSGLSSRLVLTN